MGKLFFAFRADKPFLKNMKHYTNEEIVAFIKNAYDNLRKEEYCQVPDAINITVNEPDLVRVKVSAEYDPPVMNTRILFPLCEFFDTKIINDVDRWSQGGCETCDWGSSYGFELEIKPEKKS